LGECALANDGAVRGVETLSDPNCRGPSKRDATKQNQGRPSTAASLRTRFAVNRSDSPAFESHFPHRRNTLQEPECGAEFKLGGPLPDPVGPTLRHL